MGMVGGSTWQGFAAILGSCGPSWTPLRHFLGVPTEAFLNHWCKMALRWAPRRLLHRFWIDFGDDFEDSAWIWKCFGKILKHLCLHLGRFGGHLTSIRSQPWLASPAANQIAATNHNQFQHKYLPLHTIHNSNYSNSTFIIYYYDSNASIQLLRYYYNPNTSIQIYNIPSLHPQ